jgi:hypothetical protein
MSSYTRSSINSPPSPSSRRGGGVLLNEPSVGLDTVYDGAHQMMSTEYLYGPKGGRWSSGQAYGASFRSATPRPWQRTPTRQESMTPKLGPGDYDVLRETHTLSASIGWSTRGRYANPPFRRPPHLERVLSPAVAPWSLSLPPSLLHTHALRFRAPPSDASCLSLSSLSLSLSLCRSGPMGHPFDASRRSPPFQSSVSRFHFAAKEKRGGTRPEDCMVLATDARREQVARADFVDRMQRTRIFAPPRPFAPEPRLMTAPITGPGF